VGLVRKWERFVDLIASGYDNTMLDYFDDASVRELLEDSRSGLLEGQVLRMKAADARYLELTRFVKSVGAREHLFWRSRVPKNPGSELAEDLSRYGFLDTDDHYGNI
jgi:hypothetical protein